MLRLLAFKAYEKHSLEAQSFQVKMRVPEHFRKFKRMLKVMSWSLLLLKHK